ncbi:MAG: DUF4435 domain-containing protein [Prevotella sp.]|nr:DUF4435 domain-containing protein [Prevotella sp.]
MGRRLSDNITSGYFEAANRLASKRSRRRIVAYVESYDDVFFWRTVLGRFENEHLFFEVMLPSKGTLSRGKKSVLMSLIAGNTGDDMIACVDADYDYMLQGVTPTSKKIKESPHVFHTYVYAIENYQCYAPALHDVCVMVTLNDHSIFDFNDYLKQYSEVCYPLFVWSVWAYRTGNHGRFSISDMCKVIDPGGFSVFAPQHSLDNLRHKVGRKVHSLQQAFPKAKASWLALKKEMAELGVTPQNTYLYVQGHHIFDTVVVPIMTKVCNLLRQEREREIHSTATHRTQMRNELSCYENSIEDVRSMLKKNTGYVSCPQFIALQADVARFVEGVVSKCKSQETSPSPQC